MYKIDVQVVQVCVAEAWVPSTLNFFLLFIHNIQVRLKLLLKDHHHPKLFRLADRMGSGKVFPYFAVIPNIKTNLIDWSLRLGAFYIGCFCNSTSFWFPVICEGKDKKRTYNELITVSLKKKSKTKLKPSSCEYQTAK